MFLGLFDLDWITRIFCSFFTCREREREREGETGGGVECLKLFWVRVTKEAKEGKKKKKEEVEVN